MSAQLPLPPLSVTIQLALPSLTVTDPPGVPTPGALAATLTETLTVLPSVIALGGTIVVVVAAALTVCPPASVVLELTLLASPEYAAASG